MDIRKKNFLSLKITDIHSHEATEILKAAIEKEGFRGSFPFTGSFKSYKRRAKVMNVGSVALALLLMKE
jgi:hypothetical protein